MDPSSHALAVRPLLVGAGGLIGRHLAGWLEERYPHTVAATRTELDITDRWRLEAEIERLEPTVVINAAALADVDRCEREPELAWRVNAEGPANLAAACRAAGVRLIHFSTDYVFGAEPPAGDGFEEDDPPAPVNEYGRSKLGGEQAVLETLVDCVVLRVSFVFGPGRPTFADRVLDAALDPGATPAAVDDWRTRPTGLDAIAEAVERVLEGGFTGLCHVAGSGPAVTRLEFARRVLELAGLDPDRVAVQQVAGLALDAPRPSASPLATGLYARTFGAPPKSWERSLVDWLATRRTGDR
ncbi:MAG: NAD(P)-dependent oxidoreductase [Acidobacteria bacterium]|nr:MAG: NAD(P)-dependent oxidoreductase [Acidobacteriota bacterium]